MVPRSVPEPTNISETPAKPLMQCYLHNNQPVCCMHHQTFSNLVTSPRSCASCKTQPGQPRKNNYAAPLCAMNHASNSSQRPICLIVLKLWTATVYFCNILSKTHISIRSSATTVMCIQFYSFILQDFHHFNSQGWLGFFYLGLV